MPRNLLPSPHPPSLSPLLQAQNIASPKWLPTTYAPGLLKTAACAAYCMDRFNYKYRHCNFPNGRQRLQVAFLVLMIAYTASRQGALVYVARNEKKSRGYTIGEDDEDEDEDGNDNRGSGEEDSVWTLVIENVVMATPSP